MRFTNEQRKKVNWPQFSS